jgi:hypothetical protein
VSSELGEDFPFGKGREARKYSIARMPKRSSLAVSVNSEITDNYYSEADDLSYGTTSAYQRHRCSVMRAPQRSSLAFSGASETTKRNAYTTTNEDAEDGQDSRYGSASHPSNTHSPFLSTSSLGDNAFINDFA